MSFIDSHHFLYYKKKKRNSPLKSEMSEYWIEIDRMEENNLQFQLEDFLKSKMKGKGGGGGGGGGGKGGKGDDGLGEEEEEEVEMGEYFKVELSKIKVHIENKYCQSYVGDENSFFEEEEDEKRKYACSNVLYQDQVVLVFGGEGMRNHLLCYLYLDRSLLSSSLYPRTHPLPLPKKREGEENSFVKKRLPLFQINYFLQNKREIESGIEKWSKSEENKKRNQILPRFQHNSASIGEEEVLVFGGFQVHQSTLHASSHSFPSNHLFLFQLSLSPLLLLWQQIHPNGVPPLPRFSFSLSLLSFLYFLSILFINYPILKGRKRKLLCQWKILYFWRGIF